MFFNPIRQAALSLLVCLVCYSTSYASDGAKDWIRYPAISPSGDQVAFSYQGDIWIASTSDGQARMLTSHQGYERSPVWSPDGKSIAFMADWHGNGDVFIVPATGGTPQRLTYHSASDVPSDFSNDGKSIIFSSSRLDATQAITGRGMGELYSVPVSGGRPQQLMTTDANDARYSPDGKHILFHDYKGYEDNWRKHHTSSVTRDIWRYDVAGQKYEKLSAFAGEDRNPVYTSNGESIYYLSEQVESQAAGEKNRNRPTQEFAPESRIIPQLESSFNVWKLDLAEPGKQTKVTQHETHPVRFLTIADDDTLCYGFNGEIWIRKPNQESQKLEVQVQAVTRENAERPVPVRDGATEMAVSPNEEEVAFVVRGEVFVTNVEFGTTRRVTDTASQERSVTWGEDSRTLYYAGERNNSWNLYKSEITRDDEAGFANATLIKESSVLETDDETFQPVCSPDGKKLAYLKNRTELMILDLETGQSSTLLPAEKNFSYSDGDIDYAWSGDSRWMLCTYYGRRSFIGEIGLINVADGSLLNITESGYSEGGPLFSSNGSTILYASARYGERSHGSWGGELDVMGLYLTQAAYDKATLSKEELALKKKRDEKAKKSKDKNEESKKEDKKADDKKEAKPVKIEKEGFESRRRRLTLHSSNLGSFDLSPDGEFLLYTAQVDDKWGLWLTKIRDRSTSNILKMNGGGGAQFSKDGKSAFLMQGNGQFSKVDLGAAFKGGKASAKPIRYSAIMNLNEAEERAYIFEHSWRQVRHKFYDDKLHGLDWDGMKANYAQFLPSINNSYDFAELLGEMLGELNASHTGCRFRPRRSDADSTATLGLFYDVSHTGAGLLVDEVIERGPCDTADCKIKKGVLITHLNGVRLTPDVNPWKLLNRQADKPVRVTLSHDEKEWEEVIRPIGLRAESGLLYERWIKSRRELCDKLSGGKVGYVHVQGMNDNSFRHVYSEVLGRNNEKEALIVDTRFNGGGWLHEDLTTFLDGEEYVWFSPEGMRIRRWARSRLTNGPSRSSFCKAKVTTPMLISSPGRSRKKEWGCWLGVLFLGRPRQFGGSLRSTHRLYLGFRRLAC